MPYGSGNEEFRTSTVKRWCPGYWTYTWNSQAFPLRRWSRTGTSRNTSSVRNSAGKPGGGTFVWVQRTLYKGPKLRSKVWNKKLGRFTYAKAPLVVWRKRWVPSKQKIQKGQPGLLPNDLNFTNVVVRDVGEVRNVLSTYRYSPFYAVYYEGDLLSDFQLNGGGPAQFMASGHTQLTGTAFLSDFSSAEVKANNRALNKFYESVKNQDVNFAQALGERQQTASLLADAVRRLVRGVSALRRGNVNAAVNVLFPKNSKEIAQDWLAWQYGVKPLVGDIQGAAKLLAESTHDLYFDVKSRAREMYPMTLHMNPKKKDSYPIYEGWVHSFGSVDVTYKARIRISRPGSRLAASLGLTNLNSLAWELTPFSFIVDWLLPIGDFLNNEDAFAGLEVMWVTKTVAKKETVLIRRKYGGVSTDGNWTTQTLELGCQVDRINVTRTQLALVPPLPKPAFKDPVSLGHVANALALLRVFRK